MPSPVLKSASPAVLRLSFESDIESAREVSVAIRTFLAEQGMPEKEIFSYELCIAEACYNAVEYVEGEARGARPVAEAHFSPELIELRVTDYTRGFDLPARVPQPSPLSERGRGLFLIQAVMDEVRYLRSPSENTLVMRKRRRSGEPLLSKTQNAAQKLTEAHEAMETMGRELKMQSDILSAVFRCCAEMGRGAGTAEGFGERLLSDLLQLTAADWYVLRLLAPDGANLAVVSASEGSPASGPIAIPTQGTAAGGYEAMVAASGNPIQFAIRECSNSAEPLISIGSEGTGIVHPLRFGGTLVGTLAIGRRGGEFPVGRLQGEVVRALAEFLAIQTLNLRHRTDEVRNRVVAKEFEIAKEIQHLLLPRTLPQVAGFGLAGGWRSAREVGGDFYDAITLSSTSMILMMVDVMGKGVPAALFATTLRGLLRGLASRSSDPSQLLGSLNRLLHKDLSAVGMFMTVQIVHLDFANRRITAAGAGHCPILISHPGRRGVASLSTQGVPIGVLPESAYANVVETFEAPATMLLYTDGLTDMRDSQGRMYGPRRLTGWMRGNATPGRSATELRDLLNAEMDTYRGNAEMADDQAFLILSEEVGSSATPVARARRRIDAQPGSFLFPSKS
ncbi:MAG TPA: SpoIIE family protein phosphatase [Opitutaceae bacterium]|nr:SpoIIE family protein phosphatase [Opitutaceae bacterium]